MKERITIQIDREVAETVKELYPDMSYTVALRLLLDTSKDNLKRVYRPPTIHTPPIGNMATMDDIKELKDKFSSVLDNPIKKNKLKV